MKTLYIIRHAKSSWHHPNLKDDNRPLNERGKRDAPFMANLLFEKGIKSELLISSTAVRANATADFFEDKLLIGKYILNQNLYLAGIQELLKILSGNFETINSIMIVGHNPGLTDLIEFLTNQFFDNLPTCGIVCIELDIESWKEINKGTGKIVFFDYPKKYLS